jgi:hypothetical protein
VKVKVFIPLEKNATVHFTFSAAVTFSVASGRRLLLAAIPFQAQVCLTSCLKLIRDVVNDSYGVGGGSVQWKVNAITTHCHTI